MITRSGRTIGFLTGLALVVIFIPFWFFPDLRGKDLPTFLLLFSLAGIIYLFAINQVIQKTIPISIIWGAAILARLIVVIISPSLSDDVYRYIWDGHLLQQGVNPYAETVNSPDLDTYATPLRDNVNHPEMASPYLPSAQIYFWFIEELAPQKVKAFQIAAVVFDLLTGLVIQNLLKKLEINQSAVLLYLWHPLVIVEFANGAHLDALMIFFIMLSLNFFLSERKGSPASAIALSLATLTKGLPILIAPLFLRKWRVKGLAFYLFIIISLPVLFAQKAGWGLGKVMDGRGFFGALRIYASYWQFNASPIFRLIDQWNNQVGVFMRFVAILILVGVTTLCARLTWKYLKLQPLNLKSKRGLLRLSVLPLSAYILLSPTLHPWYLIIVLPWLPFFIPANGEASNLWKLIIPWVYFSLVVALSYLAYRNTDNTLVPAWVIWIEYLPFYAGLILVNRNHLKSLLE
jgi:alpha-1,6-mannosyltransferase